MKRSILVIAILLFSINLYSQNASRVPVEEVAVGLEVSADQPSYGPVLNYAVKENLHIGAQFGLYYDGGYDNADPIPLFYFRPYAKYFFSNIRNMRPFVQGAFIIGTEEDRQRTIAGVSDGGTPRNLNYTALQFSTGGAWYPFNNLGLYGGIRFFEYNIDNSNFKVGVGAPFLGLEFYI